MVRATLGLALALLVTGHIPPVAGAAERLETDRPDVTEGPVPVATGTWQLEVGYAADFAPGIEAHELGQPLLRGGIRPGLELRLGLPSWSWSGSDAAMPGRFGDASVGFKLGASRGRGSLGTIVALSFPTGEREFGSRTAEPEWLVAGGWDLGGGFEVEGNAGARWPRSDGRSRPTGFATASLSMEAGTRARLFAEGVHEGPGAGVPSSQFVDAGLMWLVAPGVQLDLSIGRVVSGERATRLAAGVSRLW